MDLHSPRRCAWPSALLATVACALLSGMLPSPAQDIPNTRAHYLRMLDTDGDGRISVAEYVQYMSAGFRHMDSNADGMLETAELPGSQGPAISLTQFQDNLRRQFRRLDHNHDGYLTARELTAPPG